MRIVHDYCSLCGGSRRWRLRVMGSCVFPLSPGWVESRWKCPVCGRLWAVQAPAGSVAVAVRDASECSAQKGTPASMANGRAMGESPEGGHGVRDRGEPKN